tara:strand:- start:284 stop:484 length:201 start_codon:yes stop_codon:yes gene_type:complete
MGKKRSKHINRLKEIQKLPPATLKLVYLPEGVTKGHIAAVYEVYDKKEIEGELKEVKRYGEVRNLW